MSFTATGCEVTSSGGSFGGLNTSLRFWMKERYQGSSTSVARTLAKCSSGFMKGLFGCDKSAIIEPPALERETTAYPYWTLIRPNPLLLLEKRRHPPHHPVYHKNLTVACKTMR